MIKKSDPDYIITKEGKIYKFLAWYVFSYNEKQWPGAQVKDKDGNNFGVHLSNIHTKVYNLCAVT